MADRKFTVTGPGASDFLTAPGGEDLPETSTSKGAGTRRDESDLTNPRNLIPRPGPDTEAEPGERTSATGPNPADQMSGSQTGTIGGGGPDAHNADPIRATGADDS